MVILHQLENLSFVPQWDAVLVSMHYFVIFMHLHIVQLIHTANTANMNQLKRRY